jgi:RHS repeat-associated protein
VAAVAGDVLVASVAAADSSSSTSTLYSEGFEAGVGVWAPWAAGPTVASSADTARTGSKSLKLIPGGGQSNTRVLPSVTVGVPTTLTAYVKGTGTVQPYVQYYDINWVSLGSATIPSVTLSPAAFTAWSVTYAAPAGTGIVQVAFQNFDVNPWYLDDFTQTTGGGSQAASVATPAGWTPVTVGSTAGVTLATFTHTAAAVDPVSWVFNLSQSVKAAGSISAYSGVDTVSPIDTSATGVNVSGVNQAAPSVTTTGVNRLGVTITAATAATSVTPPAGSTERADQAGGAGAPTATIETSDFAQAAVGATGIKTTVTAAAASSSVATLTLRPASGGGTTKVSYVRDVTNRIVERKVNDVTVARYTFSSSGDTPDAELDGANVVQRRTLGLMGGAVLSKATGSEIWSISNLHGDTIATLGSSGVLTGGPFTYDPFGKTIGGVPDNQIGSFDNGWLGKNQRPLELQTGLRAVIEMGARIYDPQLGRFLQTDPVEGGTANDYAYVEDPANQFDLTGRNKCEAGLNPLRWIGNATDCLSKAPKRGGELARGMFAVAYEMANQARPYMGLGHPNPYMSERNNHYTSVMLNRIFRPASRGFRRCVFSDANGFVGGTIGRILVSGTVKWASKAVAITAIGNCVRDWAGWKIK